MVISELPGTTNHAISRRIDEIHEKYTVIPLNFMVNIVESLNHSSVKGVSVQTILLNTGINPGYTSGYKVMQQETIIGSL